MVRGGGLDARARRTEYSASKFSGYPNMLPLRFRDAPAGAPLASDEKQAPMPPAVDPPRPPPLPAFCPPSPLPPRSPLSTSAAGAPSPEGQKNGERIRGGERDYRGVSMVGGGGGGPRAAPGAPPGPGGPGARGAGPAQGQDCRMAATSGRASAAACSWTSRRSPGSAGFRRKTCQGPGYSRSTAPGREPLKFRR